MTDNTPAVRRRIDDAQIDEWRNECLAAARHGADERTLETWLKENGCPPRTRQEILVLARAERPAHHRFTGAPALGLGLLLCVIGAVITGVSLAEVPAGDHVHARSVPGAIGGLVLLAIGIAPLLFRLSKMRAAGAAKVESSPR